MTYVSRHPPWPHQSEALERMKDRDSFALLMAMRTGKTKTLLDDWARMVTVGDCDDLLVIAPGGVYRTWVKAVQDHLAEDLLDKVVLHLWSAEDKTQKAIAAIEKFLLVNNRPRILLVNIEALSAVARAKTLCEEFLMQRRSMLAIDESTAIKNYKAKRTKFINQKLRLLADYRRILSGLPTPKSPLDLYTQFEFLDPKILGFKSYFGFRARYAIMGLIPVGGRSIEIVKGYRDVEELQEIIAPHSIRVKLEDCYSLPPKQYTIREVPLTEVQREKYNEVKEHWATTIGDNDHVSPQLAVVQILRLHQILCGHVGTEGGGSVTIPERRTETLLNLLEEHDGKGIIWCSYDADVQKVAAALEVEANEDWKPGDPNVVTARFWGGNRSTREDEEFRFLHDPNCRYIVATAAAGGRGRTWTVADLVVYYSNTADLEHRSQSEERAQGVNKTTPVLYVDLVAPGTIDEKMLNILRKKITMAAAVTGDGWREWLI